LTSNITFAGGGGGPSGICGNDGKICANTTLDWTSSNHGGYTVFNLDATSAPFTVTLGAAAGPSFDLATTLWFFKEDASANAITLTAGAGDTINGLASISIATPYQMVQLMSDGVHAWYVNGLATGGGGLLGMTAGQVPIAATATTVTSSKPLSGAGAGITTGPTSSTNLDCAQFSGTTGQIADAGAPCGSGGGSGAVTKIAQFTLGSPSASITFSAIPQTYSGLKLVVVGGSASGSADTINLIYNSVSTNYAYTCVDAFVTTGPSINLHSQTDTSLILAPTAQTAGGLSVTSETDMWGYILWTAGAPQFKTSYAYNHYGVGEGGGNCWGSSATNGAITSLVLKTGSGSNLLAGTQATLYGVQ
jgi:hypothetical protein